MKLCKVCDLSDWENQAFQDALIELNVPDARKYIHRKYWEFAMGIQAIKNFDKLHENAVALGVGSGIEPIIYYLANHINHVYATDIYGVGSFAYREAQDGILTNPTKFAPFPYREEHLSVEFMDARYLLYDSNTFDIVFSFSSIEHFGSRDDIKQTMAEIGRVLKPDGIAVIATEVILNDKSHPEFFEPDELVPCLLEPGNLELVEDDIDFTISPELIQRPLQYKDWEGVYPHIVLQHGDVIWTSVFLALRKPKAISADDLEVDKELRLFLSRLKLTSSNVNRSPRHPVNVQLSQSKLDSIPLVGLVVQTLRRKFHELSIFYVKSLSDYISQLVERQDEILEKQIYLIERLLLKSELAAARSDIKHLQERVESLEGQIGMLPDVIQEVQRGFER